MGSVSRATTRRSVITLVATVLVCVSMYAASSLLARVVKINTTDSMPVGIYIMRPGPILPGRIVVACLPKDAARLGLENGYLERGSCASGAAPLLKYVAAVGGSQVTVTGDKITIDGRALRSSVLRRSDRHGRRVPHIPIGTYSLGKDEVWLYSPAPWSWDSRYFGPVLKSDVIGDASPLFALSTRQY